MGKRKPVGNPKRAVAYLRVSTEDQNLGPQAQRVAIERWAKSAGVEVVAWHEDHGVSGAAALEDRPALMAALDGLALHGAGVLLVAKRDRLARDTMNAAMIERLAERAGARVLTADGVGNGDDPSAMLLRGMMDLFAQYERFVIRARTKAALAVKRERGERVGTVPFGFRLAADGVHLEPEPQEQAVLEQLRALRQGGRSIRAIAAELNATRAVARGKRWHPTTVAQILRRGATVAAA